MTKNKDKYDKGNTRNSRGFYTLDSQDVSDDTDMTESRNELEMNELFRDLIDISLAAGKQIMELYNNSKNSTVEIKEGGSPLTLADTMSNDIIVEGLKRLDAGIPVITEESAGIPYLERRGFKKFWLIDPLDGTKEFISRTNDFTVNIALVENGLPTMGVVYAPAERITYFGGQGYGAWKIRNGKEERISVKRKPEGALKVVASRFHPGKQLDSFLSNIGEYTLVSMGSSLKVCLVAEGNADIYPRFAPTMEWDTAAAQAVIEGAGGKLCDLSGNGLRYNRENMRNPEFVAVGPDGINWQKWIPKEFV